MHKVIYLLIIIGAINWGLVGLGSFFGGNWNIVSWIGSSTIENVIYVLIGLAGLMSVYSHKKDCKECVSDGSPSSKMNDGNM